MKKREPVKRKDNVLFFPDLEKRLTQKGLESLKNKKYTEAIQFLEDAREMDPENGDILIGLILGYFEGGAFQKAKILAKEMLLKGIGDYFQLVDLYLTILIQLHEYLEIISTIEALLEEKEIPSDKKEHFLTILQFSKRMSENHQLMDEKMEMKEHLQEEVSLKNLNLLSLDSNEQFLLISKLSDRNIRPYILEIQDYLKSDEGNLFLKTMLLNLLKEQEYEKEVYVHKFQLEKVVIPSELPEIRLQTRMTQIMELLKEQLENSDPTLFEHIKSLVERHFFSIYPFQLEPEDLNVWTAAFHFLALEYHGRVVKISSFSKKYEIPMNDLEKAIKLIKEIDEISPPII